MMRMIDADALKRKVQKVAVESWKMRMTAKVETVLNQFIDWIEDAPTIDAAPVMHAHWKHFAQSDDCSNCGWSTGKYESPTPYCPGCGAKMDSDSNA